MLESWGRGLGRQYPSLSCPVAMSNYNCWEWIQLTEVIIFNFGQILIVLYYRSSITWCYKIQNSNQYNQDSGLLVDRLWWWWWWWWLGLKMNRANLTRLDMIRNDSALSLTWVWYGLLFSAQTQFDSNSWTTMLGSTRQFDSI